MDTDTPALILTALVLALLTAWAALQDMLAKRRAKQGAAALTVQRGAPSMGALHTVYVATLASCLTLVNEAHALEGNRVLSILLAFGFVTYLFYFNSWFRNQVFFPIKDRVARD